MAPVACYSFDLTTYGELNLGFMLFTFQLYQDFRWCCMTETY